MEEAASQAPKEATKTFSRPQKRRMRRWGRSKIRKCCLEGKYSDTGRYAKGLHTHARKPGAMDHASGTGFDNKDRSATRAACKRMANMKYYLKGEVPPVEIV